MGPVCSGQPFATDVSSSRSILIYLVCTQFCIFDEGPVSLGEIADSLLLYLVPTLASFISTEVDKLQ